MVTEEEIERIRKSANIIDIISSYIPLTQKGKNYFGVCPFHEDHSPSMSVSEEKQIYKCFSCGAAGNVQAGGEHSSVLRRAIRGQLPDRDHAGVSAGQTAGNGGAFRRRRR